MKLSTINNMKCTGICVHGEDLDLLNVISSPYIVNAKTEAPLFNCAVYSKGYRDRNDVIGYNGIILDFDSGIAFSAIAPLIQQFNFVMYTSYGHSPNLAKYRIVIPVETMINADTYHHPAFKTAIATYFPGIDVSSADPSRFFFFPCQTPHYTCYQNTGIPWSAQAHPEFINHYRKCLVDYAAEQQRHNRDCNAVWLGKTRVDNTHLYTHNVEAFKDAVRTKAYARLDSIDWTRGTGVHPQLNAIAANLKHCQFDYGEVCDVMLQYNSYAHRGEVENIIKWMFKNK